METKEVCFTLEKVTTGAAANVLNTDTMAAPISSSLLKPSIALAQVVSTDELKLVELTEHCRVAENYLKEYQAKTEAITTAKFESEKLKAEYSKRNKVNVINSKCLQQAKNELYKYKCELKAEYVTAEKLLEFRRHKYKKTVSSYESDWEKTLRQYNANPLVTELSRIQEENDNLEKEIKRYENLETSTRIFLEELERNLKKNVLEKIVQFSKAAIDFRKVSTTFQQEKRAINENSSGFGLKFSITKIPILTTPKDHKTISDFSSVNMSMFDEFTISPENLEEEEEFLSLTQTDSKSEKQDEPESMEVDGAEYGEQTKDNRSTEIDDQNQGSEKESHYFQNQAMPNRFSMDDEVLMKADRKEYGEDLEARKSKSSGEKMEQLDFVGGDGQGSKENSRNEEMLSDESLEGYQNRHMEDKALSSGLNEPFNLHYRKTLSVSSDEASENTNEVLNTTDDQKKEKKVNDFLSKTDNKPDFSSFGRFFSMENDVPNSTASFWSSF